MAAEDQQVTRLLKEWSGGNKGALDQLMPLVYDQLRTLAARCLSSERPEHTLRATALVNEAYLRLVDYKRMQWQDRAHFFAVSAQLMRRILVEHARRHNVKRGGGVPHISAMLHQNLGDSSKVQICDGVGNASCNRRHVRSLPCSLWRRATRAQRSNYVEARSRRSPAFPPPGSDAH